MLIIGTGGLSSDVLSSLQFDGTFKNICFYNDTKLPPKKYISDNYKIITSLAEAEYHFQSTDKRFIVAVGDNFPRKKLAEKFEAVGGDNASYISTRALVSQYVSVAPKGVIVLHHAIIGNGSEVGEGSLIYCNASLGHCSIIKQYVLVSGNVCMSATEIGDFTTIGIGVNFKPGVLVGENSVIGTGSVVSKNIPANCIAFGNPAKEIKKNIVHGNSK